MKHSIATVSLSGTLPEKLRAIAGVGFDGVEIFENDLLYFDGSPSDVRKMCEDLGLEIMLFQPFRDFEGGSRGRLAQQLERAERKFELMHELGTNRILVCSNVQPTTIHNDDIVAGDLYALGEVAKKHDVLVGYEALAWGHYVNSYRHAWKLVQAANHSNVGIILDSFHTLSINDDLSELANIPADKIVFVQLADAPLMKMDVLEWSRHYRNFPGQGNFNLPAFLAPILASGYQGALSLEIFNDHFRAANGVATTSDARSSLFYLEEQTARLLQLKGNVQAASGLFLPPSPPQYHDTEFVEFAVDKEAEQRLGAILETFGFEATGQHKSKDVTLYQQGDINLILNSQPDTLAEGFFNSHGTSVCAAAYRVDNAKQLYQRADAYGCYLYEGQVGPNEKHIPAIRAPHGGLQYFVDSDIYSVDFNVQPCKQPALMTRIDHIALGIPAERIDGWTLHYRAIFGFRHDADLSLPDPYGLMKSRLVRSENGAIRIPLNASDNQNTVVSRSMANYKGSGVQHIAFTSDDIFATVRTLRTKGAQLLDIPENYYDDLQARFDLDDAFVAQLREHHMLYDTDGKGGEFLHVYSQIIEGRFFFEVIQRIGGYDAYGAANTPVRLVAQDLHWKKTQAFPES